MSSSTSSYSSHTPMFLPNILLDATNYPTWLFRMEQFLRAHNLYGFVDGTHVCPPHTIPGPEGNPLPNSAFPAWKTQDQCVAHMISQTLSNPAMRCVVGAKSSQDMWIKLRLKFAAPNKQNILQLKSNFQKLKKGLDSIETYLEKVKEARDALETVGVCLDDEDVVVTVLAGLPKSYNATKQLIRTNYNAGTIDELKVILQATEADLEEDDEVSSTMPLSAMLAANPHHSASTNMSVCNPQSQSASSSVVSQPHSPPPGFASLNNTPSESVISAAIAGFFAGRGNGGSGGNRGYNNGGRGYGRSNNNRGFGRGNTVSYNGGNQHNNNNNFRNFTSAGVLRAAPTSSQCQLCGRSGHFAKTCNLFQKMQQNQAYKGLCTFCNGDSHTVENCYYIKGFPGQNTYNYNTADGDNNPTQMEAAIAKVVHAMMASQSTTHQAMHAAAVPVPQAMMASNTINSPFWLADSGASNHMTSELQLLQNVAPYSGNQSVQIGNGEQLNITHMGQGTGQSSLPRAM